MLHDFGGVRPRAAPGRSSPPNRAAPAGRLEVDGFSTIRHTECFQPPNLSPVRFFFASRGNTVYTSMDLVKAARRGGEAAFLQLFDEHHLPLFRFAYRLTGSVADAEDIVQ